MASSNRNWRKMARAFDDIFRDVGGKETIYFTNVWKCSNKNLRELHSRDSLDKSLEACGKYLREEIEAVSP